jgi:hypothetical protein
MSDGETRACFQILASAQRRASLLWRVFQVWAISEGSGSSGGAPLAAGARARGGGGGGLVLTSKPVTLKDHRAAAFVAVAAAPAPAGQLPGSCGVYALTAAGVLVLMRATARMPDKAVDLQVRSAEIMRHQPSNHTIHHASGQ